MLQLEDHQVSSENMKPSISRNGEIATNDTRFTPSVGTVQVHFSQNEGRTILPTALIDIIYPSSSFGRNLTLLDKHCNFQISGLGGTIVESSSSICFINLKSRNSNFKIKIKAIVVSKLANFLSSIQAKIENLYHLKNLKLTDPNFFMPLSIDMIIGRKYLRFINLDGVRSNIGNGLEARVLVRSPVCLPN